MTFVVSKAGIHCIGPRRNGYTDFLRTIHESDRRLALVKVRDDLGAVERADDQGEGGGGDDGDEAGASGEPAVGSGEGEATKTPEADSEGSGGSDSGGSESSGERQSFTGEVTAVSGSVWTIGGRQVVVNGETELKDDPGLGDQVNVEARSIDGVWVAERIEKS